jgi:PAS domain S-box-containing protein
MDMGVKSSRNGLGLKLNAFTSSRTVERVSASATCSRTLLVWMFRASLILLIASGAMCCWNVNAAETNSLNAEQTPPNSIVMIGSKKSAPSPVQQISKETFLKVLCGFAAGFGALACLSGFKRLRSAYVARRAATPKVKLTRAQLKEKAKLDKRYRALFENANDLIVGTGLDGKILYVNNAWHETLDFSETEIATLSIFQLVHSESLQDFNQGFRRAASGIKIKQLEIALVSKYGKRVVVEGSFNCEMEGDEVASIQCIFRDITERKRSASALKQSEARFSLVFATSPIAIGIFTCEEGKVQDVNDSFLNMLRYDRREVIGSTDRDMNLWVNLADREQMLSKLKHKLAVRDAQCKLRTQRGEVRDALIAADTIELNGESCIVMMIHDNTDRMNLEGQLRQVQKMEGIGQLAAGVAHDFNNILTIIQGHAAQLRGGAVGLPDKIGNSVEQVSMAADRAANLTRQLLTFCRKQAMLPEVMDLNATVTQVSKMLERILGEDIGLEVRGEKNLPTINADTAMLELCLINLASNARDAMPKGGQLRITTSTVNVTVEHVKRQPKAKLGKHVCLAVADTGHGMNPETLRRIFEPFFTTKEVGKGTGLGLATVYGIIEQHQGWIEVVSEVGRGSTFKIYLPIVEKPAAPAAAPERPVEIKSGNETILLVEDEEELRELAKLILEQYKYRVLEAGSGVQALKVWETHAKEIDLLLTDMVMPEGMTGRDLAERLQAERPDIKVLYSSGYSPDVVGGYFKLPENSFFLAKPYHPPKLAQAVRECLDHATPNRASSSTITVAA